MQANSLLRSPLGIRADKGCLCCVVGFVVFFRLSRGCQLREFFRFVYETSSLVFSEDNIIILNPAEAKQISSTVAEGQPTEVPISPF